MSAGIMPVTEGLIRVLLSYAVLAPSSHNTQPWRFRVADGTISLFADMTRSLPINDPDHRELVISCGCALMNIRVAAASEGVGSGIDIVPDSADDALLARISFNGRGRVSPDEAALSGSIAGRRTYRKRFASREVPASIMGALSAAASQENCWLEVMESGACRQEVAALVAEGDSIQWANPGWRRELAAWMHPRRQGEGLVVPGIVAPIARAVVRWFDMGNTVAAKNKPLAEESPVLAVLCTAGDSVADWLAAGQALQGVLLTAHSLGLQASHLNQPIQVAALRPDLQSLMNQQGFPQILLRLGFPQETIPAAPRRPLDEVIEWSGG